MEGDEEWVDAEFRFLSSLPTQFKAGEFSDGSWFEKVVLALVTATAPDGHVLADSARHAGRARVALAEREGAAEPIIAEACRRVVMCGASSAAVSSAASAFAVGTGMLGAGASLSTAVAVLGVEMVVTTRIQLEMVYALALNYGYDWEGGSLPPALVLRMYHLASSGVGLYDPAGPFTLSPADVRRVCVQAAAGDDHALLHVSSRLFSLVAKPIGVRLAEQTALKSAVPIVSLIASSGWSYFSTQVIGHVAERELKIAAFVSKTVRTLVAAAPGLRADAGLQVLLFAALLSSALLDGVVYPFEASVYDAFVRCVDPDPAIWPLVDAVVFGPADGENATSDEEDEDGFVLIDTPPRTPRSPPSATSSSSCFPASLLDDPLLAGSWIFVANPFDAFVSRFETLADSALPALGDIAATASPFDIHAILTGLYLMAHAGGGIPAEQAWEATSDTTADAASSGPSSTDGSADAATVVDLKLEFLRSLRTYLPAFDLPVSPLTLSLPPAPAGALPASPAHLERLVRDRGTTCDTCGVLIVDLTARPSPGTAASPPPCELCAFERELKATFRPSPSMLAIAKATLERNLHSALGPENLAAVRKLHAAIRSMHVDPFDVSLMADDISLVIARSSSSLHTSPLGTIAAATADTALEGTAALADYSATATVYAADAALGYAASAADSISAATDYLYAAITGAAAYRPLDFATALSDAALGAFDAVNTL